MPRMERRFANAGASPHVRAKSQEGTFTRWFPSEVSLTPLCFSPSPSSKHQLPFTLSHISKVTSSTQLPGSILAPPAPPLPLTPSSPPSSLQTWKVALPGNLHTPSSLGPAHASDLRSQATFPSFSLTPCQSKVDLYMAPFPNSHHKV